MLIWIIAIISGSVVALVWMSLRFAVRLELPNWEQHARALEAKGMKNERQGDYNIASDYFLTAMEARTRGAGEKVPKRRRDLKLSEMFDLSSAIAAPVSTPDQTTPCTCGYLRGAHCQDQPMWCPAPGTMAMWSSTSWFTPC